jgi:hypothetical protein
MNNSLNQMNNSIIFFKSPSKAKDSNFRSTISYRKYHLIKKIVTGKIYIFKMPGGFSGLSPSPTNSIPSYEQKGLVLVYALNEILDEEDSQNLISQIYYSPRYYSQGMEYRHVILPKILYAYIPSSFKNRLLTGIPSFL